MTSDTQIEQWAQALADASPELDAEGKRIAIETYRLLARGEPVSTDQIAEATGIPTERVDDLLRSWPLVLRDDSDRIVGFWGLHARHIEPAHTISVDGTEVYGWCAMDTLFIPEILGREVHVESTDPGEGVEVRLTVTPDGVVDLEPSQAVVSFLLPEEGFTDDAIARFCHKIYFFSSPESAEEWIGDRREMFSLTVDEAFALGRAINRHRLGIIDQPAPNKR